MTKDGEFSKDAPSADATGDDAPESGISRRKVLQGAGAGAAAAVFAPSLIGRAAAAQESPFAGSDPEAAARQKAAELPDHDE